MGIPAQTEGRSRQGGNSLGVGLTMCWRGRKHRGDGDMRKGESSTGGCAQAATGWVRPAHLTWRGRNPLGPRGNPSGRPIVRPGRWALRLIVPISVRFRARRPPPALPTAAAAPASAPMAPAWPADPQWLADLRRKRCGPPRRRPCWRASVGAVRGGTAARRGKAPPCRGVAGNRAPHAGNLPLERRSKW